MAKARIEIENQGFNGPWIWKLIATNDVEICRSRSEYANKYSVVKAACRAKELMAEAEIEEAKK